jgi:hypothetical protein
MSADNKMILLKDLAKQMTEDPKIVEKATAAELQILRDFLEGKATMPDARKVTLAIRRRFNAK